MYAAAEHLFKSKCSAALLNGKADYDEKDSGILFY